MEIDGPQCKAEKVNGADCWKPPMKSTALKPLTIFRQTVGVL